MGFLLTSAQQTTLGTELSNDPESLGYAPFVATDDFANLDTILTCIRDGLTPSPNNGVIGPTGAITSTSSANPVVVTTSAPHGRATGDCVYITGNSQAVANGYFEIDVLSSTTFSIATPGSNTAIAGTGTGTGGTWTWCVAGIRAQTVTCAVVWSAMAKADFAASTAALTGLQQTLLALTVGMLNQPNGQVQFSNSAGVDTNELGIIKSLFTAGTGTITALGALKYRLGSRIESLLGISNPITLGNNTGIAPTQDDIAAALEVTGP